MTGVDHIILAVADLKTATEHYACLLGRAPSWQGRHPRYGTANALFLLDNTYLELLAVDGEGPGAKQVRRALGDREGALAGLVFGVEDVAAFLEQARGGASPSPIRRRERALMSAAAVAGVGKAFSGPRAARGAFFPSRSSMTRRASSRPGPRAGTHLLALLIMWWCRPKMPRQRSVFMETRLAFVLPLKRKPPIGVGLSCSFEAEPLPSRLSRLQSLRERSVMGHRFTDPRS